MSVRIVHRRSFRRRNIALKLLSVPVTGKGPKTFSILDEHLETLVSKPRGLDKRSEFLSDPEFVKIIRCLECSTSEATVLRGLDLLQAKVNDLSDDDHSSLDHGVVVIGPNPKTFIKHFISQKGIQTLLTLTLAGAGNIQKNPVINRSPHPKVQAKCLEVLASLCTLDKRVAEVLGESDDVLVFCFHNLVNDKLYDRAGKLIELILMSRQTTLNLCSVPNLQTVVLRGLEGRQLANFCKILAVTVSDLDIFGSGGSLYAQNKQKRSHEFVPIRDINQELVLSIGGFLKKLVDHACHLPYNPRFASTPSEIDHWMRFIDDTISNEIGLDALDPVDRPVRASTFIGNDLMDRVEALYVLSLLLVGKHRKQVQRELSELRLIPKLSDLFDSFIWRYNSQRQRTRLPGHYHGCECSPEVAVKIQFLRLVHSFCDHNDFKHLLLTPCEWEEVVRIRNNSAAIEAELGIVPDTEPPHHSYMCTGTVGLLTKTVEVLKKEQANSTFRFWLCRAIESYLRGRINYADQVFLLRRGLLQHVTVSLLNTEQRQKEIIQSSFDLLGELVKFNVDACKQLDGILNTEAKLKKGMIMINDQLVDSNMFIRAMVLAADFFLHGSTDPDTRNFALTSRLLAFFREFDKHVQYVIKLIKMISVDTLTQENVSCLNTSLVIMMLSHRQGHLKDFLRFLCDQVLEETPATANMECRKNKQQEFMSNLRKLLIFWQEHYLHKDKDCTQLEKSSRISFDFWKTTVDHLVSSDASSPLAIKFWIDRQSTIV